MQPKRWTIGKVAPVMGLLEHLRERMKPTKTLDEEMEGLIQTYRSLLPWPVAKGVPSP